MRGKRPKKRKKGTLAFIFLREKYFEFQASITPKNVIRELQSSINCPSIHHHHGISYSKVALGKIKACRCFHHSVLQTCYSLVDFIQLYCQTILFCNVKILLFSNGHTFPKTLQGHNFTSANLMHFSAGILLQHTHTFSLGSSWLMITTSRCKYVKLWKFLSESLLMGCQRSIRKVLQWLKHLLGKFSKKNLVDQIEIMKLILMLALIRQKL